MLKPQQNDAGHPDKDAPQQYPRKAAKDSKGHTTRIPTLYQKQVTLVPAHVGMSGHLRGNVLDALDIGFWLIFFRISPAKGRASLPRVALPSSMPSCLADDVCCCLVQGFAHGRALCQHVSNDVFFLRVGTV